VFSLLASIASSRRGVVGIVVTWIAVTGVIMSIAPQLDDVTTNDNEDFLPGGAEAVRAIELANEKFPSDQGTPAIVVVHNASGLTDADLIVAQQIDEILRSGDAPDRIGAVLSAFSNPQAADDLRSEDGRTLTLVVSIAGNQADDEFSEAVDWLRETARQTAGGTDLQIAVTGPAGIITDAVKVFSTIDFRVTLFTVVLVLVLLLAIYRSPLLALLPLFAIGWALVLAQSVLALMADNLGLAVNGQAKAIMSVLVFGTGTDFTLFIVSRYKEELVRQPNRWQAMRVTMTNIGPAIGSSAGTTIVAMVALLLARDGSLNALGPMLAVAVFITLIAGLTLIPALAVVMGRVAFWPADPTKVPVNRRSGFWTLVANAVARRPGLFLVTTTFVLAAMALGIPTLNPSFNFLEGLPEDTDSRLGFELLQQSFPPGKLAPTEVYISAAGRSLYDDLLAIERLSAELAGKELVVSVAGPTRPKGEPVSMGVEAFQAALAGIPDAVLSGESLPVGLTPDQMGAYGLYQAGRRFVSPDETTVRLELVFDADPYSVDALDAIEAIRESARNSAANGALAGAEVVVGGPTAIETDGRATLNRDILLVTPIVIVAIWLILAMLVRSVVAPTYLVASVLLSFAAALGLSTLVFQNVLGHSGVGYSNSVFMFIFLVSLGADYNIYIISRIREEVATRGLLDGTRHAISQTGGVITSAGIILAGTFSILTTLPLRDIFQLGFAVMLGILIDTFIVRGLLVPSIVLVLKDWNWWPSRPTDSDRRTTTVETPGPSVGGVPEQPIAETAD